MKVGTRVAMRPYGPGVVRRIGNVAEYPRTATATVQFDSGKRYAVLARRLTPTTKENR